MELGISLVIGNWSLVIPATVSDPDQTSPAAPKPVAPVQADWKARLAARLIWAVTSGVAATLRWRWRDESGQFEREPTGPVIFAIWHNRLALAVILHWRHVRSRWPDRKLAALVSASRDGGLLARTMALFDVRTARGSSSRRGAQALKEATTLLREGVDVSFTPDGPRGPRYVVQPGVIALAQLTGRPIVPVSYRLSRKFCLRTWDRFQVPLPFARCEVQLGKPLRVPRKLDDERREELRRELEQRLRGMSGEE